MAWEPDYITLAEFKHYLKIDHPTDTEDDQELPFDITAGARSIDLVCSTRHNGLGAPRQFGKTDTSEARYYTPRWDSCLLAWVIEIDDVYDSTGLVLEVSSGNSRDYASAITSFVMRPMNALKRQRVYTQILIKNSSSVQPNHFEDSARVTTDKWGWSTPPYTVKRANFIQSHRFKSRRVSAMGKAGSPQKGTQQELLADIDPDVILMLQDYVKLGRTP